jgi:hypothetical protein
MKKWMLVTIVMAAAASMAIAGGDKNRGDKGQGEVHQVVGP